MNFLDRKRKLLNLIEFQQSETQILEEKQSKIVSKLIDNVNNNHDV